MNDFIVYIPPGLIASLALADWVHAIIFLMGPYGSGKTYVMLWKLMLAAMMQNVSPDGVAYSRYVLSRLTRPQLVFALVPSFLACFPEATYGYVFEQAALRARMRFRPPGFDHDIDIEWIFLALETDEDLARVLGVETTAIFVDEARLIDPALIGKLVARLRYPANSRWHGLLLASNPFSADSPYMSMFVTNRPDNVAFYQQPGGLDRDSAGNLVGENLQNLGQNAESLTWPWDDPRRKELGKAYYERQLSTMSPEDALTGVHGKIAPSRQGKPVYSDFNWNLHVAPLKYDPALLIHIGHDPGLNSASVIAQQTLDGCLRVLAEFCTEDGTVNHVERLRTFLAREFPGHRIGRFTADPAGNQRGPTGQTTFALIRQFFPTAQPASTNELSMRHEAVNSQFRRMIRGTPALTIDSTKCPTLVQACNDKYFYKRQRGTELQFSSEPEKNSWSHVAESLGYLALGAGAGKAHVLAGGVAARHVQWPTDGDGNMVPIVHRDWPL